MSSLIFMLGIVGFFALLSRIRELERRVDVLSGSSVSPVTRTVPASSVPQPARPPVVAPAPSSVSVVTDPAARTTRESAPSAPPSSISVPAFAGVSEKRSRKDRENLESNIGGKLFTGIGALALLIGSGFFFRYAIEVGIITEPVRVALGLLSGSVLIGVGQRLIARYARYAQILSGTGIGLFYLSLYFGYASYDIFPQTFAFIAMILVTALGMALSLRHDSVALALFAQVGGFLTPIMASGGSDAPHVLFPYLILLDLGMLAVAWKKLWSPLTIVSLLGTILLYAAWFSDSFGPKQVGVASGYAFLLFLLFFLATVIRTFRYEKPSGNAEALLSLFNAGFFFFVGLRILAVFDPELRGLFAFVFAALHAVAAIACHGVGDRFRSLSRYFSVIASVAVAIGIPIQFDRSYITIGWAAEGAALAYLGSSLRSRLFRTLSLFAFFPVFIRMLFVDAPSAGPSDPWWNDRMISLVGSLVAYGMAIFFLRRKGRVSPEAAEEPSVSLLLLSSFIVSFIVGSVQAYDYHPAWSVVMFWWVLAFLSMAASFSLGNRMGRYFSFALSVVALCGMVIWGDAFAVPVGTVSFSRILTGLLALFSFSGIFLLYRISDETDIARERPIATTLLLLEAYLLVLWVGSVEIDRVWDPYWIPLFLSAVSVGAAWLALRMREPVLLATTYGVLLFSGAYALLTHRSMVGSPDTLPIINQRVLVFLVVVGAMLLFRNLLRDAAESRGWFVPARKVLSLSAHILAFFLINVETYDALTPSRTGLSDSIDQDAYRQGIGIRNAAVSVAWSLYAMAALSYGILRKSVSHRIGAILLFGAAVVKVFLYDTSDLSTLARFISYFSLGVLLLLSGYAYNRFRDRISGFVKEYPSSPSPKRGDGSGLRFR